MEVEVGVVFAGGGGLYLLLPLDEFLQFLVVVLTEIATDGLDKE